MRLSNAAVPVPCLLAEQQQKLTTTKTNWGVKKYFAHLEKQHFFAASFLTSHPIGHPKTVKISRGRDTETHTQQQQQERLGKSEKQF